MLKVLIAPDSFKDCLSASQVIDNISVGLTKAVDNVEIVGIPVSDGGEGMLEAIVSAKQGHYVKSQVLDPLMRPIEASIGIINTTTAIIEMASASGLELLSESERNPMLTTSYGTGQLISKALDIGCTKLIIGIGGSATNDGGAGMATALGANLYDENDSPILTGGQGLSDLTGIDISNMDKRIKSCRFEVACDVTNPLTGKNGASRIYGAQKGGTEKMIEQLDQGLTRYAEIIGKTTGRDVDGIPGSGAAGGMGAGLMAFLDAELKPGFQIVSELVNLEQAIQKADLIITAEGKIDGQTKFGKTPFGVAALARKFEKPVFGYAGRLGAGYQELLGLGFNEIHGTSDQSISIEESIRRAPELIQKTVELTISKYLKSQA